MAMLPVSAVSDLHDGASQHRAWKVERAAGALHHKVAASGVLACSEE
ncbi:hypothetical protein ABZ461_31290 [Actinacidiphila glaucinigra]